MRRDLFDYSRGTVITGYLLQCYISGFVFDIFHEAEFAENIVHHHFTLVSSIVHRVRKKMAPLNMSK